MEKSKEKVIGFLKKYEMYYKDVDFAGSCGAFVSEMENGLSGKPSSLAMIPTFIETDREIPAGPSVIVLDIGGTNTRAALVHFNGERKPVIDDFVCYATPGTDCPISKEEFYLKIVSFLKPFIDKADKIGVCFSYPERPLPNKDGKVLKLTKQLKVRRLVGSNVGEEISRALSLTAAEKKMQIIVINDSVATLFGGKTVFPDRKFDSYVGFILGTGTNSSYIEANSNIAKLDLRKQGHMVINLESGGYAGFHRGGIDRAYDNCMNDRGSCQYEKMVSGRYQGGLLLTAVKAAAREGVFTHSFAAEIEKIDCLESREVDRFLYYPFGDNRLAECCKADGRGTDRTALYYLIDCMNERAALFAAVNLVSVLIKSGKGTDPSRPVCITADGSTYSYSKSFKERLNFYLKGHLTDELGIYYEIVGGKDLTLIGTAATALTNI